MNQQTKQAMNDRMKATYEQYLFLCSYGSACKMTQFYDDPITIAYGAYELAPECDGCKAFRSSHE